MVESRWGDSFKILAEGNDLGRSFRVIERSKDGSRFYYDDGVLYTQVNATGANQLAYIDAMALALGRPDTILILGTAGGALATHFSRQDVQVTAIDNFGGAFEIARRWFHLPQSVETKTADAKAFLESTDRRWDAIAVDLYRGTEIPDSVLAPPMGLLLAKVLKPNGVIVWNAPDASVAESVADILREAGFDLTIRPVLGDTIGNSLVMARAGRPALAPR